MAKAAGLSASQSLDPMTLFPGASVPEHHAIWCQPGISPLLKSPSRLGSVLAPVEPCECVPGAKSWGSSSSGLWGPADPPLVWRRSC